MHTKLQQICVTFSIFLIYFRITPFQPNYPKCVFFRVLRVQEWTQLDTEVHPLPIVDGSCRVHGLVNFSESDLLHVLRQSHVGEGLRKHILRSLQIPQQLMQVLDMGVSWVRHVFSKDT